jgi:hypothetical protein
VSRFTTPDKVRRVRAYHPPSLFAGPDPRDDVRPSQAQPPSSAEAPSDAGHRCRLVLTIDDRDFRVRVEVGPEGHAVALDGPRGDRCRVTVDDDHGLHGTCYAWSAESGCVHSNAAYAAGLFPELDLVPLKPTIAVGGGEP